MKPQAAITAHNQTPRGVARLPKGGITLTPSGLPMSDHFFQATSFKVKKVGSNLIMLFGSQSAFAEETDTEYRLAVEIVFPIEMAVRYLYIVNWLEKSTASIDPFAAVLKNIVVKDLEQYTEPKSYRVPSGAGFRSFPSNFATMSISAGQGAIEFFEAPPGMLVEAYHQRNGWRPNSDVRAVLTVILPPVELYKLLESTLTILKPLAAGIEVEVERQ